MRGPAFNGTMIGVIDYGAGNLRSVQRSLEHLGLKCTITRDTGQIRACERVIFPGVGAAGAAMEHIDSLGLREVLLEVVARGVPFLGICLGTQIILDASEEDQAACLGLIPGVARRFPVALEVKIPHMGWNSLHIQRHHPLLEGVKAASQFYFVHSYYPDPTAEDAVVARCEHGIRFPAVIARRNVVAVQFHPEKSGEPGLCLLRNFSRWDGHWS